MIPKLFVINVELEMDDTTYSLFARIKNVADAVGYEGPVVGREQVTSA